MRSPAAPYRLDDLPLYAGDLEIGRAVLGPKRACEWKALAGLLEAAGLPKIDPLFGGRYVPAVKAFLDRHNGLMVSAPIAPDGPEHPEAWNSTKRQRLQA